MPSTIEIRQSFLNYFRENQHKYLPPSKVFNDDPTLLFVNAGMNQLKNIFLGGNLKVPDKNLKVPDIGNLKVPDQKKEYNPKFSKLMNSQICIRAGGKHNDLDDVGLDSYHLTSFEMLGQWSLNDYWKEEAIDLAYGFLVDRCGLNPKQMYVTYFEGDADNNLPMDQETKEIWYKYFPKERIIPGNSKDNFWMMGDLGPCGACTEIHYDLIGNRTVSELVNQDDPTVIEIWNNVFMEYNKTPEGLFPLENNRHFVDTGMGLERLSMILQGKATIYETDAFKYLFGYAQALSSADFYTNTYDPEDPNFPKDVAYRIFVDHIRTTVIALFDGVKFGPNGREYVLRKIFRRLLTHFYLELLGGKIKNNRITHHPAMKAIIDDILNFYLKKNHNTEEIQQALEAEEKLFVGKISHVKRKINKHLKKIKTQKNNDLNNDFEGIEMNELFEEIRRTEGIPMEILKNHHKIELN